MYLEKIDLNCVFMFEYVIFFYSCDYLFFNYFMFDFYFDVDVEFFCFDFEDFGGIFLFFGSMGILKVILYFYNVIVIMVYNYIFGVFIKYN